MRSAHQPAREAQRALRRTCLAVLLLGPALMTAGAAQGAGAQAAAVPIGQPLREALMQGLNGPPRALSSFRGRPLIINVWASWCGPCRAEMASLERLAWGDLVDRFTVIGISTDDHIGAAQALLRRSNATLNHYIDRQLELETMLGATHLPLTVLVDAQGHVLHRVSGAREWDGPEARQLIERFFPKPPAPPRGAQKRASTQPGNSAITSVTARQAALASAAQGRAGAGPLPVAAGASSPLMNMSWITRR